MKVSEIFESIQGEGKFIGKPTVFIRLSGCNLRCSWCDTRYAIRKGRELGVQKIIDEVKKRNISSVCITGGEPMLQLSELKELIKGLKDVGYHIILETNGTLHDNWVFETVDCVSFDVKPPSSREESDLSLLKKLKEKDQVKIVIADEQDFRFMKEVLKATSVEVIIQPAGGLDIKPLAKKVLEERLDVRVLPQLHKIMGLK